MRRIILGDLRLREWPLIRRVGVWAEVTTTGTATTQQALSIIQSMIVSQQTPIIDDELITTEKLQLFKNELIAQLERKQIIYDNREALSVITPEIERKLTSQLRKSFADMSKPLKSSADNFEVYSVVGQLRQKVAVVDETMAKRVTGEREDLAMTRVRGSIGSYPLFEEYLSYKDWRSHSVAHQNRCQ